MLMIFFSAFGCQKYMILKMVFSLEIRKSKIIIHTNLVFIMSR